MKKEYKKPVIIVESFQLNAAIAGSCSDETGEIAIGHYETTCGSGQGEEFQWQYFSEYTCDVDLTIGGGGDDNDENCYHGPVNNSGVTFVWS